MDTIIKVIGATLVAVIIGIVLSGQGKDFVLILTIAICGMTATVAVINLKPVIEFIRQLEQIGKLNTEAINILLKCIGISIVTEIAALICVDAGQSAMGKALQFLGTAVILCLSVPVFSGLLELVEDILHAI
jgi:stage III sporulation protein AD